MYPDTIALAVSVLLRLTLARWNRCTQGKRKPSNSPI